MSDGRQQATVSGSAVMSAGLASTMAAVVTSKFGVAGTLLGAALTTMIITGGSAILRAYFESAAGKAREVPSKLRSRVNLRKTGGSFGGPELRHNFFVRLRNALSWFSYLPQYRRRSILVRGAVAAIGAFVIGMAIVTFAEAAIGNSLSCGFWGTCPAGAVAGVHVGGSNTGAGAEPSVFLARSKASPASVPAATSTQDQPKGLFENLIPGSNNQSAPQPVPGQQQSQPAQPAPGQTPSQPAQPAPGQQPVQPSPGEKPAPVQPAQPSPVQPAQPSQPAPGGSPPAQQPPAQQQPSQPPAAPAPSGGGAGQQQPSSP